MFETLCGDVFGQIDIGFVKDRTVVDDDDPTCLLDDEESVGS